ncbi:SPOR domain-containing protein [Xanthobacter pseudotagetidis]|uniref:SPOR domain-containing protein n=1 Tax=Xanthobacter pseudotagetidis TaxID=3119911 RepID=UPI003729A7EC
MVEESRFRYRRDDGMAGGASVSDARYARTAAPRAPDVRGGDRADAVSRSAAAGGGFTSRLDSGRGGAPVAYGQRYSRAPEPARDADRPGESKDSLAELARLIGDQDPFAEFSDLERKATNAPASEDDYDDDYDRRDDYDDDRYDDDRADDDAGWDDRAVPARASAPAASAPAASAVRDDGYGRADGYDSAPARARAPASAYGRPADRASSDRVPVASEYDDDGYDDEDEDAYAPPAPVAARPAQLPAPRAGAAGYSDPADARRASAAPASAAVRTGYGSLARQAAPPGPSAASSYDDGYEDDDDYYDRGQGYDAEDDDEAYAPPRAAASSRAQDARAQDLRAYDSRPAARVAALPAPASVGGRADGRRTAEAPAYGVRGQSAPAPARAPARPAPQAAAYDDDYDDGYDDETDDDGYGARQGDSRAYNRGVASGQRARGGEAAYAYSAERRDDGYDDYDDAYDPQFGEAGYMPPHGEDIYETEPRRKKGRMALLMVASVLGLLVAGAAAFFAYRMAVGEATFGSGTPSVIRADNAPVKTVTPPSTDSQGKLITERLGANGSPNERLVTREETPVEVTAATRAGTNGTPQGEPKRVKTYAVRPDGSMATPSAGAAPSDASLTAFAPTQAPLTTGIPGATAPAQTAAVTPPVAGSGSYVVQVASQRSEADAQGSWKALQAKYPSLLGNYTAQVRKADLGERGVFYRAQVGPFASRDQANELCQALRGQGGDCIVNKN